MKMVLVVADAARADEFSRYCAELDCGGYTMLPVIQGSGRTGIHAGDRIHPGGLIALFTILPDEKATQVFDEVVRRRDAAGDQVSRMFLLPVDRQA
jgi:hypothetical protein